MKHQLLDSTAASRSFVLVFDPHDEVTEVLRAWATQHRITAASFTGIGAFRQVTLGYFNPQRREYESIVIDEQVEVLTCAGNIALADGTPKVHAHVVVGKRDGSAHGGHFLDARVRPTLELVLVESAGAMRRSMDPSTGLPLLNADTSERA